MSLQGPKSRALFQKANQYLPRGVNSNFRDWGDDTLVINRGEGAYIWDADGNRYIDYRLGFGPIILGHARGEVVRQVQEAITLGNGFALVGPLEIDLAERLCRMTGMDKVRFANSGTEATMHALRVARAYSGREKFIKFEGQYHGMHDYVMFSTASSPVGALGSPRSPNNVVTSSGIPKNITNYCINVPYNDIELLEEAVFSNWQDLAAIMVEPTMGNVAGITPAAGWLKKIRELCDQYNIVLIFDEVKTGFRIANGGAQELFGVKADVATYAKSMGNGFPVAAIAGREPIMQLIGDGVAHGGTYAGNAVGMAAGIATLGLLESQPILVELNTIGTRLMRGIDDILTEHDIPHAMTGLPSMFSYILGTDEAPRNLRDYAANDEAMYEAISDNLIRNGVFPETDGREPWFLCHALSNADVDETLNKFNDSVKTVKG
jgi:glutamate-1-semialdehyde 2,1-aminomutase